MSKRQTGSPSRNKVTLTHSVHPHAAPGTALPRSGLCSAGDTLRKSERGVEQVSRRGCACPGPESAQGQVGRGLEQPGRWKVSLPLAGRWNETGFKVPSQPEPRCDNALEAALVCLQCFIGGIGGEQPASPCPSRARAVTVCCTCAGARPVQLSVPAWHASLLNHCLLRRNPSGARPAFTRTPTTADASTALTTAR